MHLRLECRIQHYTNYLSLCFEKEKGEPHVFDDTAEVVAIENFEAWEFFSFQVMFQSLTHIVLVTQSKHKDHLVPHSFNYFSYSSDCSTCKESNNFLLSLLLSNVFLLWSCSFIIFSFFPFSKTAGMIKMRVAHARLLTTWLL